MTDAEYDAAKERIRAVAMKWSKVLGLRWWDMTLEYCREGLPTKRADSDDGYSVAANCDARWQYLDATIRFNVPILADMSDAKLERIVVHECMHALVNETRETGDGWLAHEERVCSMLTDAIIWVRDETQGVALDEHERE